MVSWSYSSAILAPPPTLSSFWMEYRWILRNRTSNLSHEVNWECWIAAAAAAAKSLQSGPIFRAKERRLGPRESTVEPF